MTAFTISSQFQAIGAAEHGELPPPPLPPDVNLQNMPYLPLDVRLVRDSDMGALTSGEGFKAAVFLWAAAWHQKPAGSLPNDDRVLASLAGLGRGKAALEAWEDIRLEALYGWFLCEDGRLYHPHLARRVMETHNKTSNNAGARSSRSAEKQDAERTATTGRDRMRRLRARRKAEQKTSETIDHGSRSQEVSAGSDGRDDSVTSVTVGSVTRDVTSPLKGKGKIKNKPSPQSPPAGGDEGRGVENPSGSGSADGPVPPDPETLPALKTRIPEDWQPTADDRAFAAELGLSAQRVEAETARFVDYWLSQGTCRACWSRTWRNRIRDYAERSGLTENGMPKANAASPPDRDDRPPGPGADDPQWQAIAEAFRRLDRRGEEDWRSWLRPMGFQGIEGRTLVLTGNSRFAADKVRQLLGDRLRDAALAAGIEIDDVEVVVSQSPAQSPPAPIAAAAMAAQSPPARVAA